MRFLYLLFLPAMLHAQLNADWACGFALDIYHVDTDPAGNIYVSGAFSGPTDFDPAADTFWMSGNTAPPATFLARYLPDGSFDWAVTTPLRAGDSQPATFPDCSSSTGDCVYVAASALTGTPGQEVARVLKYASNGQFLWQLDLAGTYRAAVHKVLACPDGGVVILATFRGAIDVDPSPDEVLLTEAGADNLFVARYTGSGALLWVKQFLQVRDGTGLAMDARGNIWLAANFYSTAQLDPDGQQVSLVSGGSSDAFVARLTGKGAIDAIVQLTGPSSVISQGLAVDPDGAVLLTGRYNGTFKTLPASLALPESDGVYDAFAVKLSPSGQPEWAKRFSGPGIEEGTAVIAGPDGSVFITGNFAATTDFDPDSGTHNFRTSAGIYDQFIAHVAPDGGLLSVFTAGGPGSDRSFSLASSGEYLYFTGSIHSTVNYTPGSAVGLIANNPANILGVLVRFPLRPLLLDNHLALPEWKPFRLFPNPAHSGAELFLNLPNDARQGWRLEFWHASGVLSGAVSMPPDYRAEAPVLPGWYFVRLLDQQARCLSVEKLLVIKP